MNAFESLMARLGRLEQRATGGVELQNLSIDEVSAVGPEFGGGPANGCEGWLVLKSEASALSPAAREAAILKLKSMSYQHDPYFGELDPDNPCPLGPDGLPVKGDLHSDPPPTYRPRPHETGRPVNSADPATMGNVAVDLTTPLAIPKLEQRYGVGLAKLPAHAAQSMSMRPTTHPMVRQVLRRRANTGRR